MTCIFFIEALSACHYIPQCREKIFSVLYKALNHPSNNELRESAYECMKKVQTITKLSSIQQKRILVLCFRS